MARFDTAVDMTRGNPYRLLIRFMLPLLAGNILQQLYNLVDTLVVGNVLGKGALAAVGSGFPFMFLLSSVFLGIGLGAMIIVSQLAGQKDEESLQRMLGTIYRLILFGAVPLSLLGFVFTEPVLQLLQVKDPETLRQATIYLRVVFLGLVGTFGFNVNAGFLQGIGDSMSSLLFLCISTLMNIVLDFALTLWIPLGVLGVAIATTFAQTFSWIFGIFYINRKYSYLHIHLWRMPFDRELFQRALRLGLPAALQNFLYSIGNMIVQALVNRNGNVFIAGFVAANKVDTFVFLPMLSMATAMTTFVGQNFGRQNARRIREGTRAGLIIVTVLSVSLSAILYFFRQPSIAAFNKDPGVIQAGLYYLEAVLPFYVILALMYALNAIFQGVGETVFPMIVSSIALCLARVPLTLLCDAIWGPEKMYYAYPMTWMVGFSLALLYFFKGPWRERIPQPGAGSSVSEA